MASNIVAMWEAKTPQRTEFVYVLAWPDEAAKAAAWAKFMADEEWKQIKRVTSAAHGDLVGEIQDRVLVPTPYSPALRGHVPAGEVLTLPDHED